jgi:hypothetical protein
MGHENRAALRVPGQRIYAVSDIFQEVEEDVRRERYEQIWKKYGNYIIALASLIVLAVAGWQLWQRYDLSQRQAASDRYEAAVAVARSGDAAKAEAAFAEIAKDGSGGYATLAKFELATAYVAEGKRDAAIALLRELVQSYDPLISNPSRLRLAWTIDDGGAKPEIVALLQPLTAPDSPWRFAAAEVTAYLDLTQGSRSDAESEYQKLAQEALAPQSLRSRAAAIASYITANPAGAPAAAPVLAPAPAQAAAPAAATPAQAPAPRPAASPTPKQAAPTQAAPKQGTPSK